MSEVDRRVSSMRATAHPVRLQILSLLTGTEMSAAEIARELDISHANASYHLRLLADAGLLVEAGEQKIRGGVAKLYRHPWEEVMLDSSGGPDPTGDAMAYLQVVAQAMVHRYGSRSSGSPSLLADAEMWVTPEAWEQARTLVEQASRLVHGDARRPRSPGTIHVNLTVAAFQMAGADQEGDR